MEPEKPEEETTEVTPPKLKRIPVLQIERLQKIPRKLSVPVPATLVSKQSRQKNGGRSSKSKSLIRTESQCGFDEELPSSSNNSVHTSGKSKSKATTDSIPPPRLKPAVPALSKNVLDTGGIFGKRTTREQQRAIEDQEALEALKRLPVDVKVESSADESSSHGSNVTTMSSPKKRSSNEPSRKIIQSIFAKPKPHKSKKARKAKGKSPSKKAKGSSNKLAIGARNVGNADEDRDKKVRRKSGETDNDGVQRSRRVKAEAGGDSGSGGGTGDDNRKKKSGESSEEEEGQSKKSEDEEDFDEIDEWKPVRKAMVAAMELVAKKQVTDDMRIERRVRKPNLKPMPPKGKGRRSIFKKLQKPVRSCMESEGPSVVLSTFFNGVYHQKGDIVYYSPQKKYSSSEGGDSDSALDDDKDEIDMNRFYQIRGFLRSSVFGTTASLLHLIPKIDKSSASHNSLLLFDPDSYALDCKFGEIMVKMDWLRFVMHLSSDYYHGHDLLYDKPKAGAIYQRLGDPLFEYVCMNS